MEYRAAITLSIILFINIYSILICIYGEIPTATGSISSILTVIFIFLISEFFVRIFNIDGLNRRYKDETRLAAIIGSSLVLAYILVSIYFFIDSLLR